MRISDKTPYRNENGQINWLGRVNGTFKYGFSWYSEMMAQEKIIVHFNKNLDRNYILLRNFILPETDINIPLLLIGPPGIFIISVIHQNGLYSIRDDEWGRLTGATFVSAPINLVQNLTKLGRAIKKYLNDNGYKDDLIVEPVMIAASPGIHVETLRPAARVVLSDAIERFVISLTQAHPILNTDRIAELAVTLVKGPPSAAAFVPEHGVLVSTPVPAGKEIRDKLNPPEPPGEDVPASFSSESLGFSFDEHWNDDQGHFDQTENSPSSQSQPASSTPAFEGFDGNFGSFIENVDLSDGSNETQPANQPGPDNVEPGQPDEIAPQASNSPSSAPAKNLRWGMTRNQLLILGGILVLWLLMVVAFIIIINL